MANASSLISVFFMVAVFGGMGLYYFVVIRKQMTREGRAAYAQSLGYRPGEGLRMLVTGNLLFVDENDGLLDAAMNAIQCGGVTTVSASLTTHDRLYLDAGGQKIWFEANQRPLIRLIGRIMTKDTTGVLDMLASQTETTIYFVRSGRQAPPGACPKRAHNMHGAMEDVQVLEMHVPGRPPLRFEAVDSGVIALCQWSQPAPPMPAPYGQHPMQHGPPPYGPPMQAPQHPQHSQHPQHQQAPFGQPQGSYPPPGYGPGRR